MGNALTEYTVPVIEPDTAILEVLTLMLMEEKIKMLGFASFSADARAMLQAASADLAILSYRGKGGDAVSMLHEIRRQYDIPVLAMSCDLNIVEWSKANGFDAYIKKPFDLDELVALILSFL